MDFWKRFRRNRADQSSYTAVENDAEPSSQPKSSRHSGDSSDGSLFDLDPEAMPMAAPDSEPSAPESERGGQHLFYAQEAPYVTLATEDLSVPLPEWGGGLANSIIGAGIIGLPYAFRCTGVALGMALLVVLTVIVDWTIRCVLWWATFAYIRLIVVNAKLSGQNSYQETVAKCFGRKGEIAVCIAQFAFAFGGMCAFGIIIGDTIPPVFEAVFPSLKTIPVASLLTNRYAVIVLFCVCVSYPLSLYRDISKLARASALALVSMIIIITTVIVEGPLVAPEWKGTQRPAAISISLRTFQSVGIISFAFVCHHNSLLIYGSLKKPTLDRFARVTHLSTGVSSIACAIMALSGYLVFTDRTQGNILNNFPPSGNIMVTVARLAFGFNMMTTSPLEAFVCREVYSHYFYPNGNMPRSHHIAFTTAIVFMGMVLSLFVRDLGIVLDITGGTSACALAYIIPPLCYMRQISGGWKHDPRIWISALCILFGSIVMVIAIAQTVLKIVGLG